MADLTLKASPILGGIDMKRGDCHLKERDDLALVSIAVPLGGKTVLAKALKSRFDLNMPDAQNSTTAGNYRLIQTTPDQMMLIFAHPTPDANEVVQKALSGAGYTTDQTDAWVCLELSGTGCLAALERLCPLDLDESVFPDNAAKRTTMEHMGAIAVRLASDRFLLLSASSSAGSFLHALETSIDYTTP